MENLRELGELTVRLADGGVGLEIVHKRRCSGGFTPNAGRATAVLGLKPTLAGLYGSRDIDPAFEEFTANCNLLSLGDPALTLVLEFSDGRILMSALKSVANPSWTDFVAFFGVEKLKQLFAETDIQGLGYWSLTPDFDNFLEGVVSQYESSKAPSAAFLILRTSIKIRRTLSSKCSTHSDPSKPPPLKSRNCKDKFPAKIHPPPIARCSDIQQQVELSPTFSRSQLGGPGNLSRETALDNFSLSQYPAQREHLTLIRTF